MVTILFHGHACVGLWTSRGEGLVLDPYEPGGFGGLMAFSPIKLRYDWVACSHEHLDHAAVHTLPGSPRILESCGGGFTLRRHRVAHDEYDGRRRGGMVDMLQVEVEGARILHASDVGQSPWPADIDALRGPDVLIIPIGGFFTIGAAQAVEWIQRLDPKVVLPVHDKRPECGLPLRELEIFARYMPVTRWPEDSLDGSALLAALQPPRGERDLGLGPGPTVLALAPRGRQGGQERA